VLIVGLSADLVAELAPDLVPLQPDRRSQLPERPSRAEQSCRARNLTGTRDLEHAGAAAILKIC
jgi:hypothetical protein